MTKVCNIYICDSYLYLPSVLSSMAEEIDNIIITNNKSIVRFFVDLNLPNVKCVFLENERKSTVAKTYNVVKDLNVKYIYFYHDGFSLPSNWIIKKLRDITPDIAVLYSPVHPSYDDFKNRRSKGLLIRVKELILSLHSYLKWGIWYDYIYVNETFFPFLTAGFYKSLGSSKTYINVDYNKINKIMSLNWCIEVGGLDKILFLENVRIGTLVPEEYHCSLLDNIIPLLKNCELYIKNHPSHTTLYGREKEMKLIPEYLPGNLIVGTFKMVIGLDSALLGEAANAGCIVVCLAYLYNLPIEKSSSIEKYLDTISKDINYPKSLAEFTHILNHSGLNDSIGESVPL